MRWAWALGALAVVGCSTAPAKLPESTPGNSCETALPLTLPAVGESTEFFTSAFGFGDHFGCYNNTAPDAVYRFDLDAPAVISVDVDGGTAALSVDGACPIGCPHPLSTPPWLGRDRWSARLEPGPKVLIIGPDGVHTTLRRDPIVRGDLCTDPIPVEFDGGVFTFETDFARTFREPTCSGGDTRREPDLFFSLSFDAGVLLRHSVVGGRVGVNASCDTCTTWANPREVALGPGEYRIALQADVAQGERTSMRLEVLPVTAGNVCANAEALSFSSDGGVEVASATGDLLGASSDGIGSCSTDPDAFVRFTLPRARDLSARLTSVTPDARPSLELMRGCSTAQSTGLCASAPVAGAGTTLAVTALPAGDYWLRVFRAGEWSLTVSLSN